MKQQNSKNKILWFMLLLSMALLSLVLSSCEELGLGGELKCRGCPEDQPWSATGESYCYPNQEACEKEYGDLCEKCDRKPKEVKQ